MAALGPTQREPGKAVEVCELSSDSSSDELQELGKRPGSSSAPGISPWDADSLQKKQRLQKSEDRVSINSQVSDQDIEDASVDNNSTPALLQVPAPAGESRSCSKQFWTAGDYAGQTEAANLAGGLERCRVHPKFLHANATCHRWALGAIAELVDNAMDEVANGATFVSLDECSHPKDRSAMLVVEDDGGGMSPNKVRQCMSLGYSIKTKHAEAIGQYGNGFKTSTMRLAADVLVFSRSPASSPSPATQTIGMLSFTYLSETGQDDVIVPMIDYDLTEDGVWMKRNSASESMARNMKTIQTWSPYVTEDELLDQFAGMKDHGTKIVLYNLWEDEQGQPELDFETDPYDVQIREATRDEKRMAMIQRFPNSRHCLTYRHSLRSYLSILYLRRPPGFKIILRRQEVAHHNLVDDLMYTRQHTYRPQSGRQMDETKDILMEATVDLGFTKDAKDHVNLQGFNVYHKNRLIKPFWRIWNTTGSEGRGIIGVLEANFVVPAHDKQGLEKSLVASRLEARLLQIQKTYWANNCHKIGYVGKRKRRTSSPSERVPAALISDPHTERRLSLPSSSLSSGSRVQAKQGVQTGTFQQQGGPSRNSLVDLRKTSEQRAAGPSEVHASTQHVNQQPPDSPSHELEKKHKEILRLLKAENAEIRAKIEKWEEARNQKLTSVVARNNRIEAKLLAEPRNRAATKRSIEEIIRERDEMQTTREEERRQQVVQAARDETVLKIAELRLAELEFENHRLRSAER